MVVVLGKPAAALRTCCDSSRPDDYAAGPAVLAEPLAASELACGTRTRGVNEISLLRIAKLKRDFGINNPTGLRIGRILNILSNRIINRSMTN